jgi:cation:H+ antiporter
VLGLSPALVAALGFLAGVVGLAYGAHLFVRSAVRLARRLGVSDLVVGLTVVAVGTSLPELAVATEAALAGRGGVAVGGVVGSNVYNVAVVLGLVAAVRVVPVSRGLLRRDAVALLATTALLVVVVRDGAVSRVEGAVLLAGFVVYLLVLLRLAPDRVVADGSSRDARPRDALLLVAGVALVLGGGQLLIDGAVGIARVLGASEWIIGATVVAAGTSTPEAAVSLVALRRGRLGVTLGNVLGSNVLNVLVVLGLAAAVRPVTAGPAAFEGALWLAGLTVVVVVALRSGRKLTRPEGLFLLATEAARWVLSFR